MDLATLRAEIKTWERDFRANHGRDPSIQEIKDQPAIAQKYKLYKSLSKASSSGSLSKPATRPSTPPPPPRQPPASSILPKARAVKVDPPVLTSNPFSPVKNRKKYTDPGSSSQRASNQSRPNPFATPSKPKNKPHAPRRSPSPDPFPPIQPLLLVSQPPLSPVADSAVTRARKRLRGEPVSPSPVKEKRPRVNSQAALSFTGRAALHSPDVSDGDEMAAEPNDTIIADTPMKPRTAGKNFKVLFDDALSNGEKRAVKAISTRKKAASPAPTLLGMKRQRSRALSPSSDEDDDWSTRPKLKGLSVPLALPAKHANPKTRAVDGKRGIPKALVPTKDDLWSNIGPSKASQPTPSSAVPQGQTRPNPRSRASTKRQLPEDPDEINDLGTPSTSGPLNIPLIPPSPPPGASKSSASKVADKGKAKAAASARKKAKLLQDPEAAGEDDESLDDDEIQVKELDPLSHLPKAAHDGDDDSDWDTHWRVRPEPDESTALLDPLNDSGKLEVSLPDDLHRILAISPRTRARDHDEEKVVRSLLYGSRETHYDPSKGGEIWDVGEDSDHAGGTEEEWEGEPVPWEVGEL